MPLPLLDGCAEAGPPPAFGDTKRVALIAAYGPVPSSAEKPHFIWLFEGLAPQAYRCVPTRATQSGGNSGGKSKSGPKAAPPSRGERLHHHAHQRQHDEDDTGPKSNAD